MATYCVTFRIADKTVGWMTYDQRRDTLIRNVRTEGYGYWEEPTSFILVESDMDTYSFAAKASKGLSAEDDMLFVLDPEDQSAACFGAVQDLGVLKSFFPNLKKLP